MADGLHAVQIVHIDSKISQTGNEYLRCRLEDLFTKERCSYNVVFSDRSAPYVDRFAEAIGGILPAVGTGYLLEPKHCRSRILFVVTKTETSDEFGEQIKVTKLLSRSAAFKLQPDLAQKRIPENPPFYLPVIAATPMPEVRTSAAHRPESWSQKEFEAEQQRQTNEMHNDLNKPLNMPPDDIDMNPAPKAC